MTFFKAFGRRPGKVQQQQYSGLPNYKDGKFQNPVPTPALAQGQTMPKILWEFFKKHPETSPDKPLPFVQTDLKHLHPLEHVLVWFGHSSYFIQTDGKRFLVDPVFSGNASPIPGSLKSFAGTNTYQASDMPPVDFLIITHDHWDHLDFQTIQQLKQKTGNVICGLGVAEHFRYWGWRKTNSLNVTGTIRLTWHRALRSRLRRHVIFPAARSNGMCRSGPPMCYKHLPLNSSSGAIVVMVRISKPSAISMVPLTVALMWPVQ